MDSISGRIAKALHPDQDIRIENFRDTRLPEDRIDAVVGNVPFADVRLDYQGQRLSLHDYFFAKSIDALKPGGAMDRIERRPGASTLGHQMAISATKTRMRPV